MTSWDKRDKYSSKLSGSCLDEYTDHHCFDQFLSECSFVMNIELKIEQFTQFPKYDYMPGGGGGYFGYYIKYLGVFQEDV